MSRHVGCGCSCEGVKEERHGVEVQVKAGVRSTFPTADFFHTTSFLPTSNQGFLLSDPSASSVPSELKCPASDALVLSVALSLALTGIILTS